MLDKRSDFFRQNRIKQSLQLNSNWIIQNALDRQIQIKMEKWGMPLSKWNINVYRGILTGFNEAFIINDVKRLELIEKNSNSVEIIRPILRGRDICRNEYTFSNLFVITAWYGSHKILKEEFPAVFEHLSKYESKLKARGQARYSSSGKPNLIGDYPGQHHWLELDNNPSKEKLEEFSKPKIIFSEMVQTPQFYLDKDEYFVNDTITFITGDGLEILVRLLNSNIIFNAFKKFYAGGGLGQNGVRVKKSFLVNMPLPIMDKDFEDIDKFDYEQIDERIIKHFGFTDEEVEILNSP